MYIEKGGRKGKGGKKIKGDLSPLMTRYTAGQSVRKTRLEILLLVDICELAFRDIGVHTL